MSAYVIGKSDNFKNVHTKSVSTLLWTVSLLGNGPLLVIAPSIGIFPLLDDVSLLDIVS